MVFILVEPTYEGNQGTEMTKLEGELCYKNCFIAAVKEFKSYMNRNRISKMFRLWSIKKNGEGGVVTVALKNENLRGISEQHRFTFELYDKNSFEVNFQSEGNHKV